MASWPFSGPNTWSTRSPKNSATWRALSVNSHVQLRGRALELGLDELGVRAGLLPIEDARADLDRVAHQLDGVLAVLLALGDEPDGAFVLHDEAVDDHAPTDDPDVGRSEGCCSFHFSLVARYGGDLTERAKSAAQRWGNNLHFLANHCLPAILVCVQASSSTTRDTTPNTAPRADEELTEALTQHLFAFVNKLLTAGHRELFAAMEKEDLSITQVKSLHALADADAPMALGAVSELLGLSLPAISRSVDGLVQRGLVKREEDPRDRRSKLVTATEPRARDLRAPHRTETCRDPRLRRRSRTRTEAGARRRAGALDQESGP